MIDTDLGYTYIEWQLCLFFILSLFKLYLLMQLKYEVEETFFFQKLMPNFINIWISKTDMYSKKQTKNKIKNT
jgi:hypothetical protein